MIEEKELTDEELIELAKKDVVFQTKNVKATHVEQFIKDYQVEASDKKCNSQYIYWAYRTWCRDKGIKRPEVSRRFFHQFKQYFKPTKKEKHAHYYHVNPEPFHLEDGSQEWWDMKKFYRDKREIKKRMSSKKKSTQDDQASES